MPILLPDHDTTAVSTPIYIIFVHEWTGGHMPIKWLGDLVPTHGAFEVYRPGADLRHIDFPGCAYTDNNTGVRH